MSSPDLKIYLVSSCLMGLCSRYDGQRKGSQKCQAFLAAKVWIPLCPEQLGGLPTPRPAAEIRGGTGADVLTGQATVETVVAGQDVSEPFRRGAQQVLEIAQSQEQHIAGMCLKARSPSCGVQQILGVTAALLRQHGFTLYEFD